MTTQTLELAFSRALAHKALIRPDLMAECWSYLSHPGLGDPAHANGTAIESAGTGNAAMGLESGAQV